MTIEQIDNEVSAKIKKAIVIVQALAECIRQLSPVPSGLVYANLMSYVSIDEYQSALRILKDAGCISESNHLLTWILDN